MSVWLIVVGVAMGAVVLAPAWLRGVVERVRAVRADLDRLTAVDDGERM